MPNSSRIKLPEMQAKVAELRAQGLTFTRIAAQLGVTYQRVQQIHRSMTPTGDLRRRPRLTIATILKWADEHHRRTGTWPNYASGVVAASPNETWNAVHTALRDALRGLPGGSSLAKMLAKRRGVVNQTSRRRPLTVELILQWVDAHFQRTGHWPTTQSGLVQDAPGERWINIDLRLGRGYRGLPGGTTLSQLIKRHRPGARVIVRPRPSRPSP